LTLTCAIGYYISIDCLRALVITFGIRKNLILLTLVIGSTFEFYRSFTVTIKQRFTPLPDIVQRIEYKIQNPTTSLVAVAKLIETEPVLTGRILKLANSVMYGGGRAESKSLSMAIGRLGLETVRELVYSFALSQFNSSSMMIDTNEFWRHGLAVAILSKLLSKKVGHKTFDQDTAYLAGLMHDVGIIVFSFLMTDEYDTFLETVSDDDAPLDYLEQNKFVIDHAELGAEFLEKTWQISGVISASVRKHHGDFFASPKKPRVESIVQVANRLCNDHGISNGINVSTDIWEDKYLTGIGIRADLKDKIMEDLDRAIVNIETMLI